MLLDCLIIRVVKKTLILEHSQLPMGSDNTASDAVHALYKLKQKLVEKLTTFRTVLENLANKRTEEALRTKIILRKDI